MSKLIRASRLEHMYERCGWPAQEGATCDRRLAEFMFRNLQGSDYVACGYGSIEDVVNGDIAMLRRYASDPGSDVHLGAVLGVSGLEAILVWYALQAGGLELLPPDYRERRSLTDEGTRAGIAYGDWLIVDGSSRARGLGGLLFAILLDDMARAGYRYWYGRTVVPDNRELYDKLYRRIGRAELLAEWEDGPVRRIGFLGDLRGGWTRTLLERTLRDAPGLVTLDA